MSDKFDELVEISLGQASMAWSETPKGIFDSDTCSCLALDIVMAHDKEISAIEKKLAVAVKALKKLSQSGDGSHADKKASFYDCLPTLQTEFDERKYLAKDTLAQINETTSDEKKERI